MQMRLWVDLLALLSLSLFVASLIFPRFYFKNDDPNWRPFQGGTIGFHLLIYGWLGLVTCEFAWLANPMWMITVVLVAICRTESVERRVVLFSTLMSGIALAFSLSFLLQSNTYWQVVAGSPRKIAGYLPGYYLWVGSMLALFIQQPIQVLCHDRCTPKVPAVSEPPDECANKKSQFAVDFEN